MTGFSFVRSPPPYSQPCNQEDFRGKLAEFNGQIATIKANIADITANIQTLQDSIANSAEFMDFIQNNRDRLARIVAELNNLSPADKKIFVESLVPDKIKVGKGWEKVVLPGLLISA